MKSPANVPKEAQDTIKTALMAPQQNFGKDMYTTDLDEPEKTCWLGTEPGLLGASTSMEHAQLETGDVTLILKYSWANTLRHRDVDFEVLLGSCHNGWPN